MHPNEIYALLKRILAGDRPVKEITADTPLRGKPPKGLGYTDAGLLALANVLNIGFRDAGHPIKPPLTPGETSKAQTVRDLFTLIRKRFKTG
jgi:hypothetical protein